MATAADPNRRQVGGSHYLGEYQHWDMVCDVPFNYFEGQISKYVARWRRKGGPEDLEKARHFCDKLLSLYQQGRLPMYGAARNLRAVERFLAQRPEQPLEARIYTALATYTDEAGLARIGALLEDLQDPEYVLPSEY